MRICIVLATHWGAMKGGAENQAHLLADYLATTKGCEVVYLGRWVPPESNADEYSYRIVRYKPPKWFESLKWGQVLDSASIYSHLKEIDPDVILQFAGGALSGVCAKFADANSIPYWWYVASDNDLEKNPNVGTRSPVRVIDRWFFRFGVRRADHVIVQSHRQASMLADRYEKRASAIVRNFHVVPASPSVPQQPPLVLWVGSVKPLKRPELFVELAESVEHVAEAEFVLVGRADSPELEALLSNAAQRLENFSYVGELSLEAVNEIVGRSYLLVNTSEYEGFPNTFVQAWMRGVPTLSLDIDPDGVVSSHGLGVVCTNLVHMKEALLTLLKDKLRRDEYGIQASRFARENFSMANAERIFGLLQESVSGVSLSDLA